MTERDFSRRARSFGLVGTMGRYFWTRGVFVVVGVIGWSARASTYTIAKLRSAFMLVSRLCLSGARWCWNVGRHWLQKNGFLLEDSKSPKEPHATLPPSVFCSPTGPGGSIVRSVLVVLTVGFGAWATIYHVLASIPIGANVTPVWELMATLFVWLNDPGELTRFLPSRWATVVRDALLAASLTAATSSYPLSLFDTWDASINELRLSLVIELQKRGLMVPLDRVDEVLGGIHFAENHPPSDRSIKQALALLGGHLDALDRIFHYDTDRLRHIRQAIRRAGFIGRVRGTLTTIPVIVVLTMNLIGPAQ